MRLDLIKLINQDLKPYGQLFVISPKQLKGFSTALTLDWKKVRFAESNRQLVPSARGIYAFIVELNEGGLPPHGYVMYVGISGETGGHNLRKRYGDYLGYRETAKRAGVHYMLRNWDSVLFFHYAEVQDRRVSLRKLEREISDALVPPFSTNDFSAEIRKAKKAF